MTQPLSFRLAATLWLSLLCAACAPVPTAPTGSVEDVAPEAGSGFREKRVVRAERFMIATANPHATRTGLQILEAGGSALDAAIAAQLVLNLTEPQSSGIGGGAFIVHYDAASREVAAYDGRETAPAAARPDRFVDASGKAVPLPQAIQSGLSVGVPGLLKVLDMAHGRHGKLTWAQLFAPAIKLAEEGFPVSERLHQLLLAETALRNDAAARAYFYEADGKPRAVGHVLKNPAFAKLLKRVAARGPDAFYRGAVAKAIVAAVAAHPRPGDLAEQDLAEYRAVQRDPLCGHYRDHRICGMPPPSSGGIAVLAMLGVLERFELKGVRPNSTEAVHLFSEAGRLAYADRDQYVGDPAFVQVPTAGLVDPQYLRSRSALISPQKSMGRAQPGTPAGAPTAFAPDLLSEVPATSHISVIDKDGNAISMTTTIESQFGSRIMVHGFLLNNQMTDFALVPTEGGKPVANRIEPGKRPRSSMAPTLVFSPDGRLRMTVGSPGGSAIINYVGKTLVGVLDWGLDVQQAISLPNMGSRNRQTEVEKGTALEQVVGPLKALGHDARAVEFTSGIQGIVITPQGLLGGADPRREGVVMGR
jgi:gamma-glutamyltranspeptidase/glutathione hydrolase